MHLGQVLGRLMDEAAATQTLVELEDIALLARVKTAATDHGVTLGQIITSAVDSFTSSADADHWVQLMSVINRAQDPGREALKLMLEASLPSQ